MLRKFFTLIGILSLFGGCVSAISNNSTQTASTAAIDQPAVAQPGSSGKTLSMKDYNRLKEGMTKAEVEKVLGAGQVAGTSSGGGLQMEILTWTNPDFSSISVTLMNGRVNSISQFGLK
jgi:hypothetical protein